MDGFWAWFSVSVALPAALPSIANLVKLLLNLSNPDKTFKANLNPITAIKDGQLSWVAVSLAATGIYEAFQPPIPPGIFGYVVGLMCVLYASGEVFSDSVNRIAPWPSTPILQLYSLWVSVAILAVAAFCATGIHYRKPLGAMWSIAWHAAVSH